LRKHVNAVSHIDSPVNPGSLEWLNTRISCNRRNYHGMHDIPTYGKYPEGLNNLTNNVSLLTTEIVTKLARRTTNFISRRPTANTDDAESY